MAQLVKNLHAMQETLVRIMGQEDPLERDSLTHSKNTHFRILGLLMWLSWYLKR